MLRNARKKNPDMKFVTGSCEKLPYEDSTFDAVMTCMAYHHFSGQAAFRKEALRVLKPGGMLYVCDPNWPGFIRGIFNGIFKVSKTDARFYTPDALVKQFTDNGFFLERHIKDSYVQVLVLQKARMPSNSSIL